MNGDYKKIMIRTVKQKALTYKEADKLAYNCKWKLVKCKTNNCWCSAIKPIEKITFSYRSTIEEYYIVNFGCITTKLAKEMVKLHNKFLLEK